MRMNEIVEKISELYRSELSKRKNLQKEFNEVTSKLAKADYDGGKNITYDEYQCLKTRRTVLQRQMNETDRYCKGISDTRDLIMDIEDGETEVCAYDRLDKLLNALEANKYNRSMHSISCVCLTLGTMEEHLNSIGEHEGADRCNGIQHKYLDVRL